MKRSTLQPLRPGRISTPRRYARSVQAAAKANPTADLFSAIGLVWLAAADSFGAPLASPAAHARVAAG